MTPQNAASHLGLFCLHREISSRNEIKKITPNTPKNESGLAQLKMMGESIRQIWVKNVIVRIGVFHTICSLFGTIGKMMRGSGLAEIVIESGICASGSLDQVLKGKHYNRAFRVHKLVIESLERLACTYYFKRHCQSAS